MAKTFEEYSKKLKKYFSEKGTQEFFESATKNLGARFIREVKMNTPVGKGVFEIKKNKNGGYRKHTRGKDKDKPMLTKLATGGTLRRGWTTDEENALAGVKVPVKQYIKYKRVAKQGSEYKLVLKNHVKYARYVEYGHRQTPGRYVAVLGKRLKRSWVAGQFPMTKAEMTINKSKKRIVKKAFQKWLEEAIKND